MKMKLTIVLFLLLSLQVLNFRTKKTLKLSSRIRDLNSNKNEKLNNQTQNNHTQVDQIDSKSRMEGESSAQAQAQAQVKTNIAGRDNKKYSLATKVQDGDRGNIFKLSEHPMECPSKQALTGFQLYGTSGWFSNKIGYQFSCGAVNASASPEKMVAGTQDSDKAPIIDGEKRNAAGKISEIEAACPKNAVIKNLSVKNDGKSIFYKTECIEAYVDDCKQEETENKNIKWNFIGDKAITQLDQFAIKAADGRALQNIKAIHTGNNLKYVYTTCDITKTSNPPQGGDNDPNKQQPNGNDPNKQQPNGNDPNKPQPDIKNNESKEQVQIVHKESGLCLDVKDSKFDDGNSVILFNCNGGDNQKWNKNLQLNKVSLTFNINGLSKVLDTKDASNDNRAKIIIWLGNKGDNQKWDFDENKGTLKSVKSEKCIDVPENNAKAGVQLQQYDCNDTKAQTFELRPMTDDKNKPKAEQVLLVHKPSGLCLDIKDGKKVENGDAVILYGCHGGANQKWDKNIQKDKKSLSFNINGSEKVLDVKDSSNANGGKVIIWDKNGGDNQKWEFDADKATLKSKKSGKCLDVPNNDPKPGVELQQYECNGTAAQTFEPRAINGDKQQPNPNDPNSGKQQPNPNDPNAGKQQPNPNDPNAGQQPNPNDPNAGKQQPNPNDPNAGKQQPNPNDPNAGKQQPNPNDPNAGQQPNPNDPNAGKQQPNPNDPSK